MEVVVLRQAYKDLVKIKSSKLHPKISNILKNLEEYEHIEQISQLTNVKKLSGYQTHYRIRVGDYRICFTYYKDKNSIEIIRVLPRGQAYKNFPETLNKQPMKSLSQRVNESLNPVNEAKYDHIDLANELLANLTFANRYKLTDLSAAEVAKKYSEAELLKFAKEFDVDLKNVKKSSVNEATVEVDAVNPKDKNLVKLLKKHNVSIEVINKKGPSGYPEVKLTGAVKDLKIVLADEIYGWDDESLAEYIEESLNEAKLTFQDVIREIKTNDFTVKEKTKDKKYSAKHKSGINFDIELINANEVSVDGAEPMTFEEFLDELVVMVYDDVNETLKSADLVKGQTYFVTYGDVEAYATYIGSSGKVDKFDNSGETIEIKSSELSKYVINEDKESVLIFEQNVDKFPVAVDQSSIKSAKSILKAEMPMVDYVMKSNVFIFNDEAEAESAIEFFDVNDIKVVQKYKQSA